MTVAARGRVWVPAAAAALLLGAACQGGDDHERGTVATPSVTASHCPTGTTRPPTATAAPGRRTGVESRVREAWTKFLDPRTSVADRTDRVEDGEMNALMVRGFAKDPCTRRLRVRVTAVRATSANRARVTYTLVLDGRALPPSGPGTAVRQGDTWKVSLRTLCSWTRFGADVPQAPVCAAPTDSGRSPG